MQREITMDSVRVPGHSKAGICDREVIYVTSKHSFQEFAGVISHDPNAPSQGC